MNSSKNKRIEVLSEAALSKKRHSEEATEKAIKKLIAENQPITVANVARTAGVSTSYIYKYPELKSRINFLKTQQTSSLLQKNSASDNSKSAIIHTLRLEIKRLNSHLAESQRTNQLLLGKIYEHQETENICRNLNQENIKQLELIKQLQSELLNMKQDLLVFQQKLDTNQVQPILTQESESDYQVIDGIIGFKLQSELSQLGIKLNTTLIQLIQSLTGNQVKDALSFVNEVLSTGKKVRSKAALFRTALEMNCPPHMLPE